MASQLDHLIDYRVGRNHNKPEAKDVLPKTNCTEATKRAKNAVFCPW